MCGIAGIHLKHPDFVKNHEGLETFANALFLGIEPRGKRASGFVAVKPGGEDLVIEKADMTASDFIQVREELPRGTSTVLLHTRLDTKGSPKENKNNHPVICNSTFSVHNGAIYNDDELFQLHQMERQGEVDSEVISALLHKTGLDNAKEALEQFQGAMAIASIDPVRSPDKLLLAKGEWSPLAVLENDDFIVWASERKAIEEAWALVLGTPPKWKRFHHFSEGEYWLVDGDQVTRDKFSVTSAWQERNRRREAKRQAEAKKHEQESPKRDDDRPEYGWPWNRGENGTTVYHDACATSGVQHPLRRADREEWTTRRDLKDRVIERRAVGRSRARLMDSTTQSELEDVKGLTVWMRCTSCHASVLREDIHKTLAWGKMCLDCYDVAIALVEEKNNPGRLLSAEEKRVLNNWVKIEAMIHRKALNEIAEQVEMDPDTIEFLVFRCPKPYSDRNKKVNDLAAELDDRYQETTAVLFAEHGIQDATDPAQTVERETKAVGVQVVEGESGPFVSCIKHARLYRKADGCEDCENKSRNLPLPFSGTPYTNPTCHFCKTNGRSQRARVTLGALAFCNTHFDKCTNDCELKGVGNAVATDKAGTRYCHYCARGVKGLLFDGSLKSHNLEVVRL